VQGPFIIGLREPQPRHGIQSGSGDDNMERAGEDEPRLEQVERARWMRHLGEHSAKRACKRPMVNQSFDEIGCARRRASLRKYMGRWGTAASARTVKLSKDSRQTLQQRAVAEDAQNSGRHLFSKPTAQLLGLFRDPQLLYHCVDVLNR